MNLVLAVAKLIYDFKNKFSNAAGFHFALYNQQRMYYFIWRGDN